MIFLKYDETGRVNYQHHKPFHEKHGVGKSKEQLEQEGILVDSIPEPEQVEGKQAIMYVNPETKELWYEYEDIPKTPEQIQQEELAHLKQEDLNNKEAIAELYMMMPELGGM